MAADWYDTTHCHDCPGGTPECMLRLLFNFSPYSSVTVFNWIKSITPLHTMAPEYMTTDSLIALIPDTQLCGSASKTDSNRKFRFSLVADPWFWLLTFLHPNTLWRPLILVPNWPLFESKIFGKFRELRIQPILVGKKLSPRSIRYAKGKSRFRHPD